MPQAQVAQCDCGTAIKFQFKSLMEIITCPHCKKLWTVDVWGNQRETTEADYEAVKQLSRSKEPMNIDRGR